MKTAARTILYSQIIFFAGLLVAVALKPSGLSTNDGISYYGIYSRTLVPYAIGLLGAACCALRAAVSLDAERYLRLRLSLQLYAALIAGLVITPYAAGSWVDYLHTACGSTLFALQLLLSGWLIERLRYVWWSVALTVFELAMGILSAFYLHPTHGFLLQTQALFQLAFGTLLFLSLNQERLG